MKKKQKKTDDSAAKARLGLANQKAKFYEELSKDLACIASRMRAHIQFQRCMADFNTDDISADLFREFDELRNKSFKKPVGEA